MGRPDRTVRRRVALGCAARVRDDAQVRGAGKIDLPTAQAALQMLEVDKYGFDEVDRRLLLTIIEKFDGGPVGIDTLASAIGEAVIPVARPRFVIDGGGTVFHTPALSFRAAAGAEAHF